MSREELQILLSPDLQQFLKENQDVNPEDLLLHPKRYPTDWPLREVASQLKARQKAAKKLPSWTATPKILFPSVLAVEQASSEATAAFKAATFKGYDQITDLTGGLGVDVFCFARHTPKVNYVERDLEKVEVARHNFSVLGQSNIEVIHGEAGEFLASLSADKQQKHLIYLDPARRSEGQRVFLLEDCSPDVLTLQHLLENLGADMLIKTAPLLDIAEALRHLRYVRRVLVVAFQGECKEVLYWLSPGEALEQAVGIEAVQLENSGAIQHFTARWGEESEHRLHTALPQAWIYLPHAALSKAGLFQTLSARLGLPKLHRHAHVYTSRERLENFPGKTFRVLDVHKFDRKALKKQWKGHPANLLTRHFPLSVAQLRKQLQIPDGGTDFLLFTTDKNEQKIVIRMQRVTDSKQ